MEVRVTFVVRLLIGCCTFLIISQMSQNVIFMKLLRLNLERLKPEKYLNHL